MTSGFRFCLAWIVASLVALAVALAPLSSALIDGQYVPIGPDGFYHARRILDAVADFGSFSQFDALMHVPEGSIIPWPWAYDFVMSVLVRAGLALHLSGDALAVLVHIPVIAFPLCLGLVLYICRLLSLGPLPTAMAMLASALFPLNQTIFGVGSIDHHFAEHLFVLAALAGGLSWLRAPESIARAATAGAILGLAPGVHSALFILQLPVVLALCISWFRGTPLPRNAWAFGAAQVVGTLAVALPSLPLREGHFEFHTLSWFQVYIAGCTAVVCVMMSRLGRSPRNVGILSAAAIAMLIPLVASLADARSFISVSTEELETISEAQSPIRLFATGGLLHISTLYSGLIVVAPLSAALCVWSLVRERDTARLLFWVTSLVGLALLCSQMRLHYFGSFALYLPMLLVISERIHLHPAQRTAAWGAVSILMLVAFAPGVKYKLFERGVLSGDPYFDLTHSLYAPLAGACEREPGVLLAFASDGHYARFHTDCAIIASPFVFPEEYARKAREARALMSLSAAELMSQAPQVRYVLVHRETLFSVNAAGQLLLRPMGNPNYPDLPLVVELMTASPAELPAGMRVMAQVGSDEMPLARVIEITATESHRTERAQQSRAQTAIVTGFSKDPVELR